MLLVVSMEPSVYLRRKYRPIPRAYSGGMAEDDYEPSRAERILVAMTAVSIGLSVLCFIVIVVVTGVLRIPGAGPIWSVVVTLPLVGLPLGLVLFASLLVTNFVRRRVHTRSQGR